MKNLLTKKDKSKNKKFVKNEITEEFYLGLGDTDIYSNIQVKKTDSNNKVTMLRSLFENEIISNNSIKEIYGPVDGSAEEIKEVAKFLSPLKSKYYLILFQYKQQDIR